MGPPKSTETRLGEALGDEEAQAPELFAVPTGRALAALALTWLPWVVLIYVLAVVVLALAGYSEFARTPLVGLLVFVPMLWRRLVNDAGFTAKLTQRGLTLSHGLTTRVSQTVPPGKVLAVELKQGPLWRWKGWWRASINVAGYSMDEPTSTSSSILVPVADEVTVRRAIAAVAPGLAQESVWQAVVTALTGSGPTPGFVSSPRVVRWLDPLLWRRNAVAATPHALVFRLGFWVRRVQVVPHGRIQGLSLHQGPWERRLSLASVLVYSTEGPVWPRIHHLAATDAVDLLHAETKRLESSMRAVLAGQEAKL
jgi:putative membrane protein